MLDKFDYAEPACPLCDGKDFYYPQKDAPLGKIPVDRIIDKVDSLFNKNDYEEAGRLLEYWKNEARAAIARKDMHGLRNAIFQLQNLRVPTAGESAGQDLSHLRII